MDDKEFQDYLQQKRELIDSALDRLIPGEEITPSLLHRAMRYSILAPAKRIRPILCLAACWAVGGDEAVAVSTACALELIHTYSLIHDDLPSMDDDDLRRGLPTSHNVFGEGAAILAGDAILSLAFEIVARDEKLTDRQCRLVVEELARAGGSRGLVGGQQADLESQGKKATAERVEYIHSHKTGAIITAAVRCGAIAGKAGANQLAALTDYGLKIGLAFQIKDDILDIQGLQEKLGKSTRQDEKLSKATYPAILGLEKSRRELDGLISQALNNLRSFGDEADTLRCIARFIMTRET